MLIVMKFGGTAFNSKDKLQKLSDIILSHKDTNKIICVISALDGVTDSIFSIVDQIKKRNNVDIKGYILKIKDSHNTVIENINNEEIKSRLYNIIDDLLTELETILNGLVILKDVSQKSLDYLLSFGERLSTPIISGLLNSLGLSTVFLTGREAGILTDSNFGDARPLMKTTKLRVSKTLEPLFKGGKIPIITGFIGADQNGNTTTLGRSGSDYIATILAASINAKEVWLWTDMDGLMTADPKIVANSRVIREVSFAEAMEMSMFGSKHMHPRALEPVIDTNIPVRIKNISNPKSPGTLILQNPSTSSQRIVKSICVMRRTSLIDVGGLGLVGIPGTAAKIFEVIAENKINIIMISQNPSESSISMIVRKEDIERATITLELKLLGKLIKNINIYDNVAIIAVVGSGMRGIKGVAARVFETVAKRNVNIIMITQGSSELNLAFVVDEQNCESVINALHEEFNLSYYDE